jgi:serine/threonine protein kinase
VLDGGTAHPYLLLEYLDAVDLRSYVKGKGLPEAECLEVVLEVARALTAIHGDGFVHGDISPENILRLNNPNGSMRFRLIDFGDAHRHEAGARAPEIAGKPAFIAPEQARGFMASAPSDVYSLGMTLFYLRAGRTAFESHNSLDLLKMHETREIDFPDIVSRELRSLIARMCNKLPSGRLQAGLVVEAVEGLLRSHDA